MNSVAEFCLAFLATAGLLALLWLFLGPFLAPVRPLTPRMYAVLPAKGDGETLEHSIHHLLWLQSGRMAQFTILIVDVGLTDFGRTRAQALLQQEPALRLCPLSALTQLMEKDLT